MAGTALVMLTPLLAVTALVLRITLGRGVLFRQSRVGRYGEDFDMLKFRTMRSSRRVAQIDPDGPDRRTTHKTAHDPRHTSIGRLLRKTSVDELPQLLHVIRGEMSLVGPRPELSSVVDRYDLRSHLRHTVKPGLTGEWQIELRGNGQLLHECFDADLSYLRNVTFRNDVRVLVRTVGVLFRGS